MSAWDTLSQQVKNKIATTADKLFGTAQSFIQANPTPVGWAAQQLQPKITQATNYIRMNPAPTNLAMNLMPKAQGMNTPILPFVPKLTIPNIAEGLQKVNLPTINSPQALKSGIPLLQAPEQINTFSNSYGKTLARFSNPVKLKEDYSKEPGFSALEDIGNALDFLPVVGGLKILKGAKVLDEVSDARKLLTTSVDTLSKEEKLSHLLNYPAKLSEIGYTKRQIDFIDATEARKIFTEGITPLDHPSYDKAFKDTVAKAKTYVKEVVQRNDIKRIEQVQQRLDPNIPVKAKVNILDYLRTPERVLQKLGLTDQAKYLRNQYESYLTQLPDEIEKIREWQKRVPSPESNVNIFRHLDGEKVELSKVELRVADEIRSYLADWATKLKLPPTKRVSDYITHIWQKGAIEGEFDPEIARLIDQKVAKGVYDPFLLKRTGGRIDYLKDTWKALDVYVHRGTRKYNLDPALEFLEKGANNLDVESYKYIQKLTSRINMRPTEVDTLIDNFIKSIPGVGYRFGQRPVTMLTQNIRQSIYRGALGMNVSSAVRNLTQGANTYAELGEKYTVLGYLKMLKNYGSDELERVGVLRDSFVQDQSVNVYKTLLSKLDKGLFFLFEQAEKVNRGSAYYGAKARALAKGLSEEKAIEEAVNIVRKTQFTFGSIDTPVALSSDIVKTFSQFMSYNVKQGEFLMDKVMQKDVVGIIRYLGATIVLQKLLKDNLGIKSGNEDANTIQGALANTLPSPGGYTPPIAQMGSALWNSPKVFTGTDAEKRKAQADLLKAGSLLIPGGSQIKKTYEGITSYNKGESTTPTGNIRFPIDPGFENFVKSMLFGQYATPQAQSYFDTNGRPLSEKQSEFVRGGGSYQGIMDKRVENKEETKLRDEVRATGKPVKQGATVYYLNTQGEVTKVEIGHIPDKPQLTGDYELDKRALTNYKSALTSQKNKVMDAVLAGVVSLEEVKSSISTLSSKQSSSATKKGKKGKLPAKITLKKITMKKPKKLARFKKFKLPKLATTKPLKTPVLRYTT